MSVEDGYSHYKCDRPSDAHSDNELHEAFIKNNSAESNEWHVISYRDTYGVEKSYVLCDECYKRYKTLCEKFDTDFNAFIGGKN